MSFAIVLHYAYVTCIFFNQISKRINSSFKRHFALWQFLSYHNTQFRVVAFSVMPQHVVVSFFRSMSVFDL